MGGWGARGPRARAHAGPSRGALEAGARPRADGDSCTCDSVAMLSSRSIHRSSAGGHERCAGRSSGGPVTRAGRVSPTSGAVRRPPAAGGPTTSDAPRVPGTFRGEERGRPASRASNPFVPERTVHASTRADHGSRRARLPQLQRGLPRRPRRRGRRLHRDPDPVHRRPDATRPSWPGPRYPQGIPIHDESELTRLIRDLGVDDVVFSYSDVSPRARHAQGESRCWPPARTSCCSGPKATMLKADVPVVAVCAVRTGCGQEPDDARHRARRCATPASGWSRCGTRCPTGTSRRSACSGSRRSRTSTATTRRSRSVRSTSRTSRSGTVIYAGVDYGDILAQAQAECDVLLWDGGNNDLPVLRARTCTSSSPTRSAPATRRATTRVRRTCGWPTRS